jgi:hypothetical protein
MSHLKELLERYHKRLKVKDLNPELLDTREPLDDSPVESDSEKAVKNMIKQRDEKVEEAPKKPEESFFWFERIPRKEKERTKWQINIITLLKI